MVLASTGHAEYVLIVPPSAPPAKAHHVAFHKRLSEQAATYTLHEDPKVRTWRRELARIALLAEHVRLAAIMDLVLDLVTYRPDAIEHWATPVEVLTRGFGDCEDFAGLYLASAELAGFDPSRMWVMAGTVRSGTDTIGHAVALVRTSEGETYVLDNRLPVPVPDSRHRGFRPVYSLAFDSGATVYHYSTHPPRQTAAFAVRERAVFMRDILTHLGIQ